MAGGGGGSTRFDRTTGQVYREQLVAASRRRRAAAALAWHQEPAYTATRRRRPGRRGPASLLDMAIKLVADNIGRIGVDALRCVPAALVWRVWDYLDHRRRGVNFHAWKTILLALPDHGHPRTGVVPPQLLYHQVLRNPQEPLQAYLDPLAASPFEFLTGIVLGKGARFDEPELLALPRLRNLAFLALAQPSDFFGPSGFPRVTDRLIREWAHLPDPFPALRSLLIINQGIDQGQTTTQSLVSVARFPALEMYAVSGRRADWDVDPPMPRTVADCWRRQECRAGIVNKAADVVSLLREPYANLELGNGEPYRLWNEAQYVFHRVRPGDDPTTPVWRLGFHLNERKRKEREEEARKAVGKEDGEGEGKGKGVDARPGPSQPVRKEEKKKKKKGQDANAQPEPSQPPRAKRLKGLGDVFQSFGA